jgi:hypothetical protein
LPGPVVVNNTFNLDGRWGDYFSVWPDPNDGSLWVTNEWTRSDTGTWSTWWTQVSVAQQDQYVNWSFSGFQNGTASNPWTMIGAAHANITSGNIRIAPGHYNEQLTLNKAVTLSVNGTGQVVIGAP